MDNKVVRYIRKHTYGAESRYPDIQESTEVGSSSWLLGQIVFTHQSLRLWIGTVALLFPFALILIGTLFGLSWPPSISDYYWHPYKHFDGNDLSSYWVHDAPIRVFFVGGLYAIGFFLMGYRGYRKGENYLYTLAGICAAGVATFPMNPCDKLTELVCAIDFLGNGLYGHGWLHGACALGLFFFLATAILMYSDITLKRLGKPALERKYHHIYRVLAYSIFVLPLITILAIYGFLNPLLNAIGKGDFPQTIYVIEILAIVSFASFWLIKSIEISVSEYDRQLALGIDVQLPLTDTQ